MIQHSPEADRDIARLAFARSATGDDGIALVRASMDAGFRSYWRTEGPAESTVVMDSPPWLEDVRPWLAVADLLHGGGVRVPRVLARDVDAGFLLLEDLGRDTLLQLTDAANADAVFDGAIDQLLKLQAIAPPASLPRYDAPMLQRELDLFPDWFLARHLGIAVDDRMRRVLDEASAFLVHAALAQPQVLVHRDYMPRNLMPAGDGPAVLDFQDAVIGPVAYDVLSLFKDAFGSWPRARIDAWVARYHARAAAAGLPVGTLDAFRRDFDLIGVQRHLKVVGIFARLCHRDAKPKYVADAPRFLRYLADVLPAYPELAALDALLRERVHPSIAPMQAP